MNYPPGANEDSRAPWYGTTTEPVKVKVTALKNQDQVTGSRSNYAVFEKEYDFGATVGYGHTLDAAIADFEESYQVRNDQGCIAIVTETKLEQE